MRQRSGHAVSGAFFCAFVRGNIRAMKTTYLGLELPSPVVVSSSPYTATVPNVEACVRNGVGAVVLKSIFEEQVMRQTAALEAVSQPGMGDAGEYVERYLGEAYKAEFLELVRGACATGIPVIASINCYSLSEAWVEYAAALVGAGASALELNVFLLPTDPCHSSAELERVYAGIVSRVVEAVAVPVSVKLPMRLTNILSLGDALWRRGARGLVLYNRFFEPDIDVERLRFVPDSPFSAASELRNVLRHTALCATALPQLDLAVSTGVHDGPAAVKALLCGARAAQVCTAIHLHGYAVIGAMNDFIDDWAARHNFGALDEFCGSMDYGRAGEDILQRVQYMQYFPHEAQ